MLVKKIGLDKSLAYFLWDQRRTPPKTIKYRFWKEEVEPTGWETLPKYNKKDLQLQEVSFIWDQRDSNPRPRDYESPALPLRHSPVAVIFNFHLLGLSVSGETSFLALPTSHQTRHLVGFASAECHRPMALNLTPSSY